MKKRVCTTKEITLEEAIQDTYNIFMIISEITNENSLETIENKYTFIKRKYIPIRKGDSGIVDFQDKETYIKYLYEIILDEIDELIQYLQPHRLKDEEIIKAFETMNKTLGGVEINMEIEHPLDVVIMMDNKKISTNKIKYKIFDKIKAVITKDMFGNVNAHGLDGVKFY